MNEDQQFLRPSDLAPLLGVSASRIYQMLAAGVLPSVRIAGAIRIPRAAWKQWLESQRDRALEAVEREPGKHHERPV